VHVSNRTISFGNSTYNLNNDLSMDIVIPDSIFGISKDERVYKDDDAKSNSDDESEGEFKSYFLHDPERNDWIIQSVQAMSATSNMIALAMRGHQDFCFIVKPAPGSRKVSIVGY